MTEAKNWVSVPIWSFARRVDRRGHGASELLSVYRDYGVVPKSSRDDNFNKASEDLDAYQFVQRGDLVLNKMNTWQGSLAVSEFEGIVSPAYFVCKLTNDNHPKFLHYLLRSAPMVAEYGKYSKGIRPNQWDLPFDEFKSIKVKLPPLDEQRRIADFLDDQVTRIDQAIEGRRQQLGGVSQRGEARIAQLLSETAEPRPLKQFVKKIGSGKTPRGGSDVYVDSGVVFLRSQNVHNSGLKLDDVVFIDARADSDMSGTRVQTGDVLLNITGGSLGRVAIAPSDLGPANVSQHVCIVRPRAGVASEMLAASLFSFEVQAQIFSLQVGGNREGLNFEQIASLLVRLPNDHDYGVMDSVNEVVRMLNDLVVTLNHSTAVLENRKRALIAAAVTGQLNVATARPLGFSQLPEVGNRIDSSTNLVEKTIGKSS